MLINSLILSSLYAVVFHSLDTHHDTTAYTPESMPSSQTNSQNVNLEMDWVHFNSAHLLPAVNWALSYQNIQKENVAIDPDFLRLKSSRSEARNAESSSPEDFTFEIE